jgi:uncharacterized repeat protein (TIGR04138 family)
MIITEEELIVLEELLDHKYPDLALLLVNSATFLTPRLIQMNFFSAVRQFETPFHFTTKEVAITIRIMMLKKYGLMFDIVLKNWGINGSKELNEIINEMGNFPDSGEIANITEQVEFDSAIFQRDPLMATNSFSEIEVAEEICEAMLELDFKMQNIQVVSIQEMFNELAQKYIGMIDEYIDGLEESDEEDEEY